MDQGVARGVFAIALLALFAFPPVAAEVGRQPTADTTGPIVSRVEVLPDPVMPGPVLIRAIATDDQSPVIGGEFVLDDPLTGPRYGMTLQDGVPDSTVENLTWVGSYDKFPTGWHTVYVHAQDNASNWSPVHETRAFLVADPSTAGPLAVEVSVAPLDVERGSDMVVNATFLDPFGISLVVAAEYFLDTPGSDGTGTQFRVPIVNWITNATWTGTLLLPYGVHAVYAHAQNDVGTWGAFGTTTFTARSPAFSFRILADRSDAWPGEFVTYTVLFENHGNAAAADVWIVVDLAATLAYADDTAAAIGGLRSGMNYTFADVAPGAYLFTIRAQVLADVTDGSSLAMSAVLDYTNTMGWDYPALPAGTAGTVTTQEIALALRAPEVAYAGEVATLALFVNHTGVRTLPEATVRLTEVAEVVLVADTAAAVGGTLVAPGTWRFVEIAPGTRTFEVVVRIDGTARDGLDLEWTAAASYVSRLGDPVSAPAAATSRVTRPLFDILADADRHEVARGGRVTLVVDYANLGSVSAGDVWINVTLPPGVVLVGGDSPTATSGSVHTWVRADVGPGSHRLTVVVEARVAQLAEVDVDMTYTSPNGVLLDRLAVHATIAVSEGPSPLLQVYSGLGAIAVALAFAGYAATERGKSSLLFLLVPLYTRLRREHVLDNETRGMIRGYIVANPGDHYNSIKDALELPNGTLAYHLQVLHKEKLVRSVKDGKFRRFYPFEMRVPAGGQPTKIQRVILEMIRANPGVTPRDLAGLLGITSSTVSYHLEKVGELGLIEFRREGITKRLYLRTGEGT